MFGLTVVKKLKPVFAQGVLSLCYCFGLYPKLNCERRHVLGTDIFKTAGICIGWDMFRHKSIDVLDRPLEP